MTGAVYLSDTSTRKVFKIKSLNKVKDVAKNLEVVAGTGDQCLPYDETRCGDGGKATEAPLTNPRGMLPRICVDQEHMMGGFRRDNSLRPSCCVVFQKLYLC